MRVARHGHSEIPGDVRKMLYSRFENQVDSFSGSSYVNVDTLFQLVDASLYASLVRLKDGGGSDFLDGKTYEEMYADVRECVDLCHRDGAIKDFVKADPGKYVVADEGLRPMLEAFRAREAGEIDDRGGWWRGGTGSASRYGTSSAERCFFFLVFLEK